MAIASFKILGDIYQTPRSVICLVEDVATGEKFAFKRLRNPLPNPYELARLRQEFATLQEFQSERIIRAQSWERIGEHYGILMEYIATSNLQDLLARENSLTLGQKLQIALSLAQALQEVHSKSIIHRDINPRNILVDPKTLAVKLIDFSIATHQELDQLSDEKKDPVFEGSLAYMSPEQTGRMNRLVDARSDLYSLGVTLFEMLAGKPPFVAQDLLGFIHAHIAKKPVLPSSLCADIPPILDQLILRLLEKNVEERYQTAAGLISDLADCARQWRETRSIALFTLGQMDANEAFTINPKLYGREKECEELLAAYERANEQTLQIVAVAGHSGIGKTSLVRSVDPVIVAHRGFFIKGKFDQFQRNLSLSAILDCFRELVAQSLLRPEEELDRLKQQLQSHLGGLASLILELVPDFQAMLNPAGEIPSLPAAEASRRTLRALLAILHSYAKAHCPVVIFLDDLQWADQASFEWMRELAKTKDLTQILLILAYRNNEVSIAHPLMLVFEDIEKMQTIHRIAIGPLAETDTEQLVGDAVRRHDAEAALLARWIHQQSDGNPFFITEVLKDIAKRKLVSFDQKASHWTWNLAQIVQQRSSDNVVQFLLDRIAELPAGTIALLKVASCVGHSFALSLLADYQQSPLLVVLDELMPALNRGLLVCVAGDVPLLLNSRQADVGQGIELRFRHDRIQQAADSMLTAEKRAEIHLNLGRMLSKISGSRRVSLEMAAHYFEASALVKDPAEVLVMLESMAEAAAISKLSNAYESAYRLLSLGLRTMPSSYWQDRPALAFKLHSTFFDAAFLTSRFQESEPCALLLLQHCETLQQKIEVMYGLCFQYVVQGRTADALRLGRETLAILGVKLPKKPILLHSALNLLSFRAQLKRKSYEQIIAAPEISDPLKRLVLKIMFEMIAVSVNTGEKLVIGYLVTKAADLALRYGNSAEAAYAYVLQASVLQIGFNDRLGAKRIAETGLAIMDRLSVSNLKGRTLGGYANFIHNWHFPATDYQDYIKKAMEAAFEEGDLLWIAATGISIVGATRSLSLADSIREQNKYLLIVKNTKQREFIDFGQESLGYMLSLTGQSKAPDSFSFGDFDEAKFELAAEEAGDSLNLIYHYLNCLDRAITRDQWAEARLVFQRLEKHREAFASLVAVFDYHLFRCLLLAHEALQSGKAQRWWALLQIGKSLNFVSSWAEYNPGNFTYYRQLITAIQSELKGDLGAAAVAYEAALESSRSMHIFRVEALTLQIVFNFYQAWGLVPLARVYLQKTLQVLHIWGASSRIEFLKERYPHLVVEDNGAAAPGTQHTWQQTTVTQASHHTLSSHSLMGIDSLSLIKASQALIGEVRLETLLQKLAQTLLENVGADRAALVLGPDKDGRYRVKIVQDEGGSHVAVLDQELDECTQVCQSLVRSVARSGKVALINDGSTAPEIKDDPYIKREKPQSLLCVPMRNQGRLGGVIYLENRITRGAFTADRLQIVEVLATQAAMSIDNAQLYRTMEQKIDEKTRDIRSILSNIQQGIFTIKGPQLAVEEEYSIYLESIFERPQLARLSITQLLFSQSNLNSDQQALVKNTLESSLGEELLAFELNASHLPRELTLRLSSGTKVIEVDWHPITDQKKRVAQILVSVRDVTALRVLEAETTRKQLELERIGELLNQPPATLQRFFVEGSQLLAESLASLSRPEPDQARLSLARALHTLKGMARSCGLGHLTSMIHDVEEQVSLQRASLDLLGLQDHLDQLKFQLQDYQLQFERLVPSRRDQVLTEQLHSELLTEMQRWEKMDVPAALRQSLLLWQQKLSSDPHWPLLPWLLSFDRSLSDLAKGLNKEPPKLLVDAPSDPLTTHGLRLLERILTHLFRNALDHGLESLSDRTASQKPIQGTIRIHAERQGDWLSLRFADDGRGLDLPGIAAKALTMGLCSAEERDPHKLARLIFHPGFSTRTQVTEVSGRGVGMDAVAALIKEAGGTLEVLFTSPDNWGLRNFALLIQLPWDQVLLSRSGTMDRRAS